VQRSMPRTSTPPQRHLTAPGRGTRHIHRHKGDDATDVYSLVMGMARLGGFEPTTYGLEIRCSIQLSYRRSFLRPAKGMGSLLY
jgi:hypothetical protein